MQVYNINNLYNTNEISFTAMKKRQFKGIDFSVVEKYKAPIEKFNILEDFQIWSKVLVGKITQKNFQGRHQETVVQRNKILSDWFNGLQNNKYNFSYATILLVLGGITKGLKKDNDTLPPIYNEKVLSSTVSDIDAKLLCNPKLLFDFNKIYVNNLKKLYSTKEASKKQDCEWFIIPSRIHDSENFADNIEKLKLMSSQSWCTKTFNAETYLKYGDFHIYVEQGIPKICVRFIDDKIIEVQGELNNSQVPLQYIGMVDKYIKDNNFSLDHSTKAQLDKAIEKKKYIDNIKKDLKNEIENKNYSKIFNYFGIKTKSNIEGQLVLSEYHLPKDCTYTELGIDENDMINHVVGIEGNASFYLSDIKNLNTLEFINGDANFSFSQIEDLGKLSNIGGTASFGNSLMTNLGNLKRISKNAMFGGSKVVDLGNLESIGGFANFRGSQVKDLGNLTKILGNVNFEDSEIEDLQNLKYIGGNAIFENSSVISLANLESIEGYANLSFSQVSDLGNLHLVGMDADLHHSKITDLGNLEAVGGVLNINGTNIKNLEKLKTIFCGDIVY